MNTHIFMDVDKNDGQYIADTCVAIQTPLVTY